jgi:histidyl-tRNA synthetase
MKSAGKSADFAVILGKEEMTTGTITLKDLTAGTQEKLTIDGAIHKLLSL